MKIIKKSINLIFISLSLFLVFILNVNAKNIHAITNIDSKNNDASNVTILTPGLGSNYKVWSHLEENVFGYAKESIIAKMGDKLNNKLDIYIAKANSTSYDLYYLSFNDYKNNNNETKVDTLINNDNYKLLLYSPSYVRLDIDDAYDEFHRVIDDFSEKYKDIYNYLPKYNLVAHSRGGIINILYATNHPYNISKIYSIASPYGAINIAKPTKLLELFNLDTVVDSLKEDAAISSILDDDNNKLIRDNWNKMLNDYDPNIEYYSFAYAETIPFLLRLTESGRDENQTKKEIFDSVNLDMIDCLIKFIANNQYFIHMLYSLFTDPIDLFNYIFNTNLYDKLLNLFGYKHDEEIPLEEFEHIFENFGYDKKENKIIILHDFLVDYNSAFGMSFDDGIEFNGFNKYLKVLDITDTYRPFASYIEPIVGHNVAVYDDDTIDFIVSNINYGNNEINNIDDYINLKPLNYIKYIRW